ncbi:hypothetical protein [Alkaliphilus transvaalensis]|uniref:hypothetical protein n=1 Tax=Alkaliphilus transvaalensis TaxID=114628 RepID=UPI0004796568|nr:hypothetical protein [Alkaliphilus transvaalensis]
MENILILFVSTLAGVVTYYISVNLNKGAVFGSAIVTLVSGLLFPNIFPSIGAKLAIVATCASYAGMVAVKNVPKLWEMAIVSFITGGLYIATTSAYVGVGGKLGTIAAIACFSWIGCKKMLSLLKVNKKEKAYKRELIDQH